MNELISVIILNYNGVKYLRDCFTSLQKQTYPKFEILMVDNNSTDNSVAYVKENFPGVRIMQNRRNTGFAEGNNIGVANASGRYVVLLNNDTIVDETWLTELYTAMQETKSPLLSSFIKTREGDSVYNSQNGTLNLAGYYISGVFNKPDEAFFASGCSMMFDKEVVGLPFDPDYFFYSEDVYVSWLTRLRGYKVCQAPASIVRHVGSATTNTEKTFILTFYQERNRLLNLFIFYSRATLLKIVPYIIFDAIFRPFNILFNPRKSIRGWFSAVIWLFTNPAVIMKKRKYAQGLRKLDDNSILENMSCHIGNGKSIFVRFANGLSFIYNLATGLNTIEVKRYLNWSKSWEIDVALRYSPIVSQLSNIYRPETEILEVGSSGSGITRFYKAPVTSLDIHFYESPEVDQSLITKVTASVENIPFPGNYFDVLISVDMFEHLDENMRIKALNEFFRVLKPGGKIFLSVPCGSISSIHERILNAIYKIVKKRNNPWLIEHINFGLPKWNALHDQIKSLNA
jgi:GT2 family glycosyltransferase